MPDITDPIYRRLTRRIDEPKSERIRRGMWAAAGLMVAAIAASWINLVWYDGSLRWLGIASLGLALLASLVLPPVISLLSATITHRDIQGENYDFLRLTPLSGGKIVRCYIDGVTERARPLRDLMFGLIPVLVIGVEYLDRDVNRLMPPGPVSQFQWNILCFTVFAAVISVVYLYIAFHQLEQLAVNAGIYAAFRLRQYGFYAALPGSSLIMASMTLGASVACAYASYWTVVFTAATLWLLPCLCGPLIIPGVFHFAAELLKDSAVAWIERTRQRE